MSISKIKAIIEIIIRNIFFIILFSVNSGSFLTDINSLDLLSVFLLYFLVFYVLISSLIGLISLFSIGKSSLFLSGVKSGLLVSKLFIS